MAEAYPRGPASRVRRRGTLGAMKGTHAALAAVLALGAGAADASAATWRTVWRAPGAPTYVAFPGDGRMFDDRTCLPVKIR